MPNATRKRLDGAPVSALFARERRLAALCLAALTALSFLAFSHVSAGLMLTRDADGLRLVICTGEGPIDLVIDLDGHPADEHPSDGALCDWSAQSTVFLDVDLDDPVATPWLWPTVRPHHRPSFAHQSAPNRHLRIRAPPTPLLA